MTAVLRGDALNLPLKDESVDLIVTSPPYFALRSYTDSGEHYEGQIGSEETPQAFLEALWAATEEMKRVLKPSGSIFVNLGDKYAGSGGHNNNGIGASTLGHHKGGGGPHAEKMQKVQATRRTAPDRYNQSTGGVRAKSLMLLPELYRVGCVYDFDLIARQVIIWGKPNGLPDNAPDRCRRSHEDWVHLTKEPRYFSATDEIREPHAEKSFTVHTTPYRGDGTETTGGKFNKWLQDSGRERELNPLGRVPGSVWEIATEPLKVPAHLDVDHFAAFPQEWPRRLILGWSPSGICLECGEGRRPVMDKEGAGRQRSDNGGGARWRDGVERNAVERSEWAEGLAHFVTGYACACPEPSAETRPAVVLDPFGGTGTVAMVARSLGRVGISVDLSHDYCRLARWRVFESGHAAKSIGRTAKERQHSLLDLLAAGVGEWCE